VSLPAARAAGSPRMTGTRLQAVFSDNRTGD